MMNRDKFFFFLIIYMIFTNCTDPDKDILSSELKYTSINLDTEYEVSRNGECPAGELVIPESYKGKKVTSIGEEAFMGCVEIESVEISHNITNIKRGAFHGCSGLTEINIPAGVQELSGVLTMCSKLMAVNVDSKNSFYASIDGVLYNKSMSRIILYPPAKSGDSFIITDGITLIDNHAFEGCTGLKNITLPLSLTVIGGWAFSECSGLDDIVIPDSVTGIGNGAFYKCTGFTSFSIPEKVQTIGDYAFSGCTGLNTLYSYPVYPPDTGVMFLDVPELHDIFVPVGSVDLYKTAFDWKEYSDKISSM